MRKMLIGIVLVAGVVFCTCSSYAFFVGFGSAGGVEQVIKKGQEEGKIPKVPDTGETAPAGPVQYTNAETVWQKLWDGGNDDCGYGIALDRANGGSGNVYVIGTSLNGANHDYLTIKYNSSGDTIWEKAYNGGNDDWGQGIAVDSSGNVYVTGYSWNGANDDYLTIKYNSQGESVWVRQWDGGIDDSSYGIAVDSSGNAYVTGQSNNGANYDCITIKYNSKGDSVWLKQWDSGRDDYGYGIAVDSSGNVYVTGQSSNGANSDYLTIKYRQF